MCFDVKMPFLPKCHWRRSSNPQDQQTDTRRQLLFFEKFCGHSHDALLIGQTYICFLDSKGVKSLFTHLIQLYTHKLYIQTHIHIYYRLFMGYTYLWLCAQGPPLLVMLRGPSAENWGWSCI